MMLNSLFKHWSYRIFAPGAILREKYEALKKLLSYDILCHEQMAELQDLLHGMQREDITSIRKRFILFSQDVAGMINSLESMSPGSYSSLKSYHKKFDFYTRFLLAPPKINAAPPYVLPFEEITLQNREIGNKAKHLAVLQNELKIGVPRGFAFTTSSYHRFIDFNDLRTPIDELLTSIDINSSSALEQISSLLIEKVMNADIPEDILQPALKVYDEWPHEGGVLTKVAVRSSAIVEDSEHSFAGMYTSVLHVSRNEIGKAYKSVIASKYSPEALFYRILHGLGDEQTAMSVLVQEMVAAKSSGVFYTGGVDSDEGSKNSLHLHAVRGLGEQLVGGEVNADNYVMDRSSPPQITFKAATNQVLEENEASALAEQALKIEKYFSEPQDIEWAIDDSGEICILQARSLKRARIIENPNSLEGYDHKILLNECERGAPGIGAGESYCVDENNRLEDIPLGAVLVAKGSPPSYVKVINRLAAVLSVHGSRASHFATMAREFNIPFLTGIAGLMDAVPHGCMVTVDGDRGIVYEGKVEELLKNNDQLRTSGKYQSTLEEALKFITPLELIDPEADNFIPEGCRSMHDIIRFCHEKALLSMFTSGKPGTGRGALKLVSDKPLDVYLFDVGGGITDVSKADDGVTLDSVVSSPFQALWQGLHHPEVKWKQKPFDWEAYDKIELAGGVPPKRDSFAFASYAVVGADYLHFNIRFGYHFTIVDVLCGEKSAENHCMLRFAGGGGDYDHRSLRINFIASVLERLEFTVERKGDLLEAKLPGMKSDILLQKLDLLGRLLGATKLMDMVLEDEAMVARSVEEFFKGRYSFSQEG